MYYILIVLTCISAGAAIYYYKKSKKIYFKMDRMMDEILAGRQISESDMKEGEISALANKMVKIQEKLNYEIGQADKEKEGIKQLISDMSHQLKTPLASIKMFQEILEDELPQEDKVQMQRRLNAQTERLEWILNSLFKLTKLENGAIQFQIEENYIKETISKAVASVFTKAETKNITIIVKEFSDFKVLHNRKWTVEVIVNILENAIKYTEQGGKIIVSVVSFPMYSQIDIQDTGIGIKREEQMNIFKRFYRSKEVENIEGSGIGLYLSKLILEQEKGYLTVKSEYKKRTCFSIHLQNCKN